MFFRNSQNSSLLDLQALFFWSPGGENSPQKKNPGSVLFAKLDKIENHKSTRDFFP
jgi:hypothetical protein